MAQNQTMADEATTLVHGAEIASARNRRLSAPMASPRVVIQTQDDLSAEVAALRAQDPRVGAVCVLVGTVRDRLASEAGSVRSLELEHYPGMTEKSIEAMVDEAHRRFDIFGARVAHRVGLLQPLDQIVLRCRDLGAPRRELPGLRVFDGD